MAAYAAVVSLMNNIDQIMIHPHLSTSFDKKYIKPLVEKAGFLLDFIEGCFSHGSGSNKEAAEDLERRITSAAHAAEDVIESHIVDQIHAGTTEVSLRCSLQLQQIIQDIDAIIIEATEEKEGWSKHEKSTHTAEPLMESGKSSTSMVGLEQELSELLREVTWDQSSRRIISIVGMGGTGKTTLATNIYQHAYVKQHFSIRAWTTISQQYDAEGILKNLLSSMIGKSTSGTVDALGEELHKALCGRRYLIVLDDIWSVEAWDRVRRFFPAQDGSRVVLTTRLSSVATNCGSSFDLRLDLLDEDKSWKLFCVKASFPQRDDPPQLEDVGKEIVKSCKGLALSIAVIGGLLLKSPRTVEYWSSVAKDIKSIRGFSNQESLDVLSLSYSHLPPHLKPCFLYMGVFREDSEIPVSKVIKLWVAEGFIKLPNAGSGESEEVAEGYIKDLIDRNLILVRWRSSSGKIKICGFHDLLRDLSLKIAEEHFFFNSISREMQASRRIVGNTYQEPPEFPLVRSIIDNYAAKIVKHRLLRVFDAARWMRDQEHYENVNLRYLTFKYQGKSDRIYEVPSSISLLWNLQTLIIETMYGDEAVHLMPDEFWKMRQLRHVKGSIIYLPNPREGEGLMLDKLQTLKGVVNLRLSEEVCSIISNTKKLYLLYGDSYHGHFDSFCEFLSNSGRLHDLESLKLKFSMKAIDDHQFHELRFPSHLKKLSLQGCRLRWEFMTEIGSLPRLEVLKLESFAVMDWSRWRPVDGQFLRLKFLKIDYCDLLSWTAESSHFPVLDKLVLIDTYLLREIPAGIGEIQTLRFIHVEGCSEDAVVSAIRIKDRRVEDDDDDDLQIRVAIDGKKLESFKERLERENLTMENIQLETTNGRRYLKNY